MIFGHLYPFKTFLNLSQYKDCGLHRKNYVGHLRTVSLRNGGKWCILVGQDSALKIIGYKQAIINFPASGQTGDQIALYGIFILRAISPHTTRLKALFNQSDSTGTAPTHK